jgi:CRISPR-associated protein Csb2
MVTVELNFPAGRLHATPWERHVNEGAVEWPPSPWRLLRALVATWRLKGQAAASEATVRQLAHALAATLPRYALPPASLGHARHYMPVAKGRRQVNAMVFDTFIHAAGPLRVTWDADLDAPQLQALRDLCQQLGYLGRAESLVEAAVLPDDAATAGSADSADSADSAGSGDSLAALPVDAPCLASAVSRPAAVPAGCERVQLLAPMSLPAYRAWRLTQRRRHDLPADIFDALHASTSDLQRAGWLLPPGSRLADYARPRRCLDPRPAPRRRALPPPCAARFAVQSAVLPRLTQAVSVAHRVRQALLARFKGKPAPAVFTGRDAAGQPLAGHGHAFIFCEANGPRDAITHVTVYAPAGFDAAACRALASLRKVWGHGGHDLQLVLLGLGGKDDFPDSRLFATAAAWESLTPFVATRHPKARRGGQLKLDAAGWPLGSPAQDLRRLVMAAGLPAPETLTRLPALTVNGCQVHPLDYQTARPGGGRRGRQLPAAFQVHFTEPVRGPLAFGYGAHFSLGLFVPVEKAGGGY